MALPGVIAIALFNHAIGEERDSSIIAVSWWDGWELSGLAALLILALLFMGHVIRIRSLRSKQQALEQAAAKLEQEVAGLTERLRLAEQNFEALQRSADTASQARSVFLTSVSHELCTPLNGILGYVTILRSNPNLDSAVIDGLDVILHSGQQLQSQIDDLLDGVRIASGQLLLHQEPIQLSDVTDHVRSLIQPKADSKGLALSTSISPEVPAVVLTDEARLRQVLFHLLGSAVKYTEQGNVTMIVEAADSMEPESSEVNLKFTIECSGKGIDPDLFQPTSLPIEQRMFNSEGIGLGLMICQSIIEKMGAKLHADSTQGVSSRVWFELFFPIVSTLNRERQTSFNKVCGYEGKRRRILVVDDKPYNRMLLKAMLEPLGFETLMGENGHEAVEQAIAWHPDAILLDLVMPVKSGFEAVQDIRQHPELTDVVIVAVSASVSDSGRNKSMEIGCNAYLAKPIRMDKLLSLLGELLALTWVYPDSVTEDNATLIVPPSEDLKLLHRLAEEGQVYEIQKVVIELQSRGDSYRPFCRKLTELAKNFELEQISDFVEQYLR